jgi:hypothetical protein
MIPSLDTHICRLQRGNICIDLEVLIFIKPYKIELIENKKNKTNQNIDKVCSHERFVIAFRNSFPTIQKNIFFSNRVMNFRLLLLSFGVIIIVLFGMFSWSTYQYYTLIHADDPITPSLTVIE